MQLTIDFGYCPETLNLNAGSIRVRPLPDLQDKQKEVSSSNLVEREWIYPGVRQVHQMGAGIRSLPYCNRIFGLPKTHSVEHDAADGQDHINFHVWALSFFLGMRLTTTPAGFIDATPIIPRKLIDFVLVKRGLEKSLTLSETFWHANRGNPQCAKIFSAAVHALFLAQNPRLLQFESFMLLYTSLDACFALASLLHSPPKRLTHANRIAWMCVQFGMEVPSWTNAAKFGKPEVAVIRNATFHEALFVGEPLGFALHGIGMESNITLEMQALICRLLVALIGAGTADYVRSALSTRQMHGLQL